jgi:hypothetical protein
MANQDEKDIAEQQSKSDSTRLRQVLSDAFTFVRSAEINQAIATVTIEDLMGDQIKRNGESNDSRYAQYNPYSYDPAKPPPKSQVGEPTNFLSGSDTSRPTKIAMIQALKNELTSVIDLVKAKEPVDIASSEEYVEAAGSPNTGDLDEEVL